MDQNGSNVSDQNQAEHADTIPTNVFALAPIDPAKLAQVAATLDQFEALAQRIEAAVPRIETAYANYAKLHAAVASISALNPG